MTLDVGSSIPLVPTMLVGVFLLIVIWIIGSIIKNTVKIIISLVILGVLSFIGYNFYQHQYDATLTQYYGAKVVKASPHTPTLQLPDGSTHTCTIEIPPSASTSIFDKLLKNGTPKQDNLKLICDGKEIGQK